MNGSSWTFEHPWFLLALPLVVALGWVRWRKQPPTLAISSVQAALGAPASLRVRLRRLPEVFEVLALAVLVLALARPQQVDREVLSGEGIDIMIALDMSGSMNAIDYTADEIEAFQGAGKEPFNRFGLARRILKDFIRSRRSDRIGLVIFGGEAYLRFPPTLDYVRLLNALDQLVLDDGRRRPGGADECQNSCTILGSGTAIGDALNRSYLRLKGSAASSRMVILITDGKQEGGTFEALEVPKAIAASPDDDKVRIYTFQVGRSGASYMPAYDPLRGKPLRDRLGRLVYQRPDRPFPTDPELLRQIAELTGGTFYQSYDPKKFEQDFQDLERTTFKTRVQVNRTERFFPLLLAGLGLLGLALVLRAGPLRTFP